MSCTDTINVICPVCIRTLSVPADYVGKRGSCNYCKSQIFIVHTCREDTGPEGELARLAATLRNACSIDELLDASILFMRKELNLDCQGKAVLFIVDKEAMGLRLLATRGGFSADFLRDEAFIPLGKCLCGRAAITGKVLTCRDCFQDPRHERTWLGMETHGHYVIPLCHDGIVLGVLTLYTRARTDAENQALALLERAGEVIGKNLQRFRNGCVNA